MRVPSRLLLLALLSLGLTLPGVQHVGRTLGAAAPAALTLPNPILFVTQVSTPVISTKARKSPPGIGSRSGSPMLTTTSCTSADPSKLHWSWRVNWS